MKDFSFWKEYEGASEGSGRSEKLWLMNPDTNQIGLFKYKKDITTTDHISECVAYELAQLIGIPCAKFEVGTYKGREGSMSYNIIDHEGMVLIEGIYCISLEYNNFDADTLSDMKTGDKYSIEMIQRVLQPLKLFDDFLPVLVFDFLIGNTDRHQSNWALIMENKVLRLSPLYDNSSSLCAYVKDSKIDQYLGNDQLLWKSLVDTKSRSLIRIGNKEKKQPTQLDVLKFLREKYYKETIDIVEKIETCVTEEAICAILDKYKEILPKKKRDLILRFLLSKVQLMTGIYGKREG
ncbi:HipA domain-containing protein [Lawsonibacter sp. OA9]|uniref:HipA domain-containing protein n=1 Tax=Oscillospiraceae TaxID=216572 RepID=UPI001F055983|nr:MULTISPECIES: HipA domain-containing protein [Oscillospiraceae]MCH1980948.1 HipA domain-containing protein [Lawsonibacter sp. OA9]MCH1981480.1 HipA domain-containing protein [Ruminococcus sp. OA3]